eukprot:1405084-Rhodomonas_salina.1
MRHLSTATLVLLIAVSVPIRCLSDAISVPMPSFSTAHGVAGDVSTGCVQDDNPCQYRGDRHVHLSTRVVFALLTPHPPLLLLIAQDRTTSVPTTVPLSALKCTLGNQKRTLYRSSPKLSVPKTVALVPQNSNAQCPKLYPAVLHIVEQQHAYSATELFSPLKNVMQNVG